MIAQLLTTKIRSRRRAARLHLQFSLSLVLAGATAPSMILGASQGDALQFSTTLQAKTDDQEVAVTASFVGKESVRPDEQIEFLLSHRLKESDGRIAVLIGTTDVSSLFTQEQLRLLVAGRLWSAADLLCLKRNREPRCRRKLN